MTDQKPAFVVPNGAHIQITESGAELTYEGDIVLHGDLGFPIHRLKSLSGNITLHYSAYIHEIDAPRGRLFAHQSLEAQRIEAEGIIVHGDLKVADVRSAQHMEVNGQLKCTTVEANGYCTIGGDSEFVQVFGDGTFIFNGQTNGERIECNTDLHLGGSCSVENIKIEGTRLQSHGLLTANKLIANNATVQLNHDANIKQIRAAHLALNGQRSQIKAMQVTGSVAIADGEVLSEVILTKSIQFSPKTHGKVMVVESQNQQGPHQVKGCLQLDDLAQFVPDPLQFLQNYDLSLEQVGQDSIPEIDARPIEANLTQRTTAQGLDSRVTERIELETPNKDSSAETTNTVTNSTETITAHSSAQEVNTQLQTDGQPEAEIQTELSMFDGDQQVNIDDDQSQTIQEELVQQDEHTVEEPHDSQTEDEVQQAVLPIDGDQPDNIDDDQSQTIQEEQFQQDEHTVEVSHDAQTEDEVQRAVLPIDGDQPVNIDDDQSQTIGEEMVQQDEQTVEVVHGLQSDGKGQQEELFFDGVPQDSVGLSLGKEDDGLQSAGEAQFQTHTQPEEEVLEAHPDFVDDHSSQPNAAEIEAAFQYNEHEDRQTESMQPESEVQYSDHSSGEDKSDTHPEGSEDNGQNQDEAQFVSDNNMSHVMTIEASDNNAQSGSEMGFFQFTDEDETANDDHQIDEIQSNAMVEAAPSVTVSMQNTEQIFDEQKPTLINEQPTVSMPEVRMTSAIVQDFFDDSEEFESSSEDEVIDLSSTRFASVAIAETGRIANIQEENIEPVIAIADEGIVQTSPPQSHEDLSEDEHSFEIALNAEDDHIEYPNPIEDTDSADDLQLLIDQLQIIEQYYGGTPPEAVQRLSEAVHTRQIFDLGSDITQIFSLLNKHHQRINSRMHPQVVHSFNIIHQHVQNHRE